MKKLFPLVLLCLLCACCAEEDPKQYAIPTSELKIRDPFVFADKPTKAYYIHANDGGKGLRVYKSKDLKLWKDLGPSFTPEADYWGKSDFWAPDMFFLNGKYYVIATFSAAEKTVKTVRAAEPLRASAVLVSDRPEGPYKPLVNAPITPKGMMALDATLFDDGEDLWLLYCHEWLQVRDGKMLAQKISRDLTKTIGEPVELFSASEAPWQGGNKEKDTYVTDAPVVFRAPDGSLLMTWSSTDKATKKYVIALSKSKSGKVEGPWEHFAKPLNDDHGGHAMLFKTFDGGLKISYHSPNNSVTNANPARVVIRAARFEDGGLVLE